MEKVEIEYLTIVKSRKNSKTVSLLVQTREKITVFGSSNKPVKCFNFSYGIPNGLSQLLQTIKIRSIS